MYYDSGSLYIPEFGVPRHEIRGQTYETNTNVTYGKAVIQPILTTALIIFITANSRLKARYYIYFEVKTKHAMTRGYDTYNFDETIDIKVNDEPLWKKNWSRAIPRQ